ncbi:hypothetical protein AB0E08_08170 [Streptomyces sp. NPDC048281]|uniref:hypothetical protein n=1 Tax=Streptomyces sp. NPDC048281 TaxID=3154715 RepID=UPI00341F05B8
MSDNLPEVLDPDASGPVSMVLVRVGNRTVPAKNGARCRVCQSPHRAKIEAWILEGYTRPAILAQLADMEEGRLGHPTEKALRSHTDRHLPLEARAEAAILERRTEQLGEEIEKFGGRVADHLSALDMVVLKGFDALQRGEIRLGASDLMKAIDLKQKIDASVEGGLDDRKWRGILMEYMKIAVEFIPPENRQAFARALSQSPVLTALSQNNQQQM